MLLYLIVVSELLPLLNLHWWIQVWVSVYDSHITDKYFVFPSWKFLGVCSKEQWLKLTIQVAIRIRPVSCLKDWRSTHNSDICSGNLMSPISNFDEIMWLFWRLRSWLLCLSVFQVVNPTSVVYLDRNWMKTNSNCKWDPKGEYEKSCAEG